GRRPGSRPSRKYTLTCIYLYGNIHPMESAFAIVAEPNRRALLGLLASSERSVGELERELGMPQPSVSKHLRVLRESGFVESRVDAQRRLYRLRPERLKELDSWLAPVRRPWAAHLRAPRRPSAPLAAEPVPKRKNRTTRLKGRKR